MSSPSETTFQDICQPVAVGLVSTEGEKLLNALRKIQTKLSDKHQTQTKRDKKAQKYVTSTQDTSGQPSKRCTQCTSGDQHSKPQHKTRICSEKTSEDINNRLIETRLKLIENQLQKISIQLSANNCLKHQTNDTKTQTKTVPNPKSPSTPSEDKYETTIREIRQSLESNDRKVKKSVSSEAIDSRHSRPKHFHLQYKDIPFILGTNSSKSYSVIANRQIEISRLKQHNGLCGAQQSRQIFNQSVKNKVLDNEIKDLLYDLQEEHNYICEEIQYLSKQLETITDPQRRTDFNRELYFLSRRILAKKRQINELKELHSIVRQNATKELAKR